MQPAGVVGHGRYDVGIAAIEHPLSQAYAARNCPGGQVGKRAPECNGNSPRTIKEKAGVARFSSMGQSGALDRL